MLAFFGGLAGFLGLARKDGNKVLAGVAIATACMPPLCTAGYGLATLQLNYFFGGLYFYMVNCLFIGLGTMLLAKYMKFTKSNAHYRNVLVNKYGSGLAYLLSIVGVVPCIFIFLQMMGEQRFQKNAERFVKEVGVNDYAFSTKIISTGLIRRWWNSPSSAAPMTMRVMKPRKASSTGLKIHPGWYCTIPISVKTSMKKIF